MTPTKNGAHALPKHDLWVLARMAAGVPGEAGALVDPRAQAIANAIRANPNPLAGLRAGLGALPPDEAQAIQAAILASPTNDSDEPQDEPPPAPRAILHTWAETTQPPAPVPWIVGGLLSRGSTAMVFGRPGGMKTYLCLDMALHVAAGWDWLGHAVDEAAPVLIVDEESGHRRLVRRLRQLRGAYHHQGLPPDLPISWVSLAMLNLANNPADVDSLRDWITQTGARLVVIDALVDVSGGADENAANVMQTLMQNLRGLADAQDCCIVLIHHSAKAGGARGSSAILGAVDLALEIKREDRSANVDVVGVKSRDMDEPRFSTAAQTDEVQDTWDFIPTATAPAREHFSKSQAYVLRFLEDHPNATIADVMNHADSCSANAARNAIYDLVKLGKVSRTDPGGPGDKATYGLTH